MIILSHRGYWLEAKDKNTSTAFERSFKLGFGVETDIRDHNGELVISHDIPEKDAKLITVSAFFELYKLHDSNLPLALNIKSDGLQDKLLSLINEYEILNYFVFDMSVPDGLLYLKNGMNVFTRCSEYEIVPSFFDAASGVWVDEFKSHWINKSVIKEYIQKGKFVCIVSPELHKRPYIEEWTDYLTIQEELDCNNMMICTDLPEKAKLFFNEN